MTSEKKKHSSEKSFLFKSWRVSEVIQEVKDSEPTTEPEPEPQGETHREAEGENSLLHTYRHTEYLYNTSWCVFLCDRNNGETNWGQTERKR